MSGKDTPQNPLLNKQLTKKAAEYIKKIKIETLNHILETGVTTKNIQNTIKAIQGLTDTPTYKIHSVIEDYIKKTRQKNQKD